MSKLLVEPTTLPKPSSWIWGGEPETRKGYKGKGVREQEEAKKGKRRTARKG